MPRVSSTSLARWVGADRRTLAKAARRELLSRSFAAFIRYFWHVVEPTRAMLPSIAMDAMTAAAQAVADGRIKRLAVATCPGTSKSVEWAVMFPAWLELRSHGRARIMVGSYSWGFATRDSGRCRDLVQSSEFQDLLDGEWGIREDADRKDDWWTTATGRRLITSIKGKSTGERCTFQIIDDPLNAADIFSMPEVRESIRWVFQVLPSRLEDQRCDPRMIVAQRLRVGDPIDEAIQRGWRYLCLPAVLGPCPELGITGADAPCVLLDDDGREVWRDPRAPGEPLVELLNLETLVRLRRELGSTTFAAQYLQRPADDSASIIKRTWWRFYRPPHVPRDVAERMPRPAGCDETTPIVEMPEHFERTTMAVDLTFGSPTGDYADATAWAASGAGRYLVDKWRDRAGFEVGLTQIKRIKGKWPGSKVLIEKAANGSATIEKLSKEITGVVPQKPTGPKAARLAAAAPIVESGCCYLPIGAPWLTDFIEELSGATNHDDQCDTTAYALLDLDVRDDSDFAVAGRCIG